MSAALSGLTSIPIAPGTLFVPQPMSRTRMADLSLWPMASANDRFLERPSDAEPDNSTPFTNSIIFNIRVVSHNQAKGDIDHRHLDAEFQAERRADVFRQSEFTF